MKCAIVSCELWLKCPAASKTPGLDVKTVGGEYEEATVTLTTSRLARLRLPITERVSAYA